MQPLLLVDVGVGQAVVDWLRNAGYDVGAVREVDPGMDDDAILSWAVSENRLVVTMDKDFGELVYRSGLPHAGVLLLRLGDERSAEKVRVVQWIFSHHAGDLPGHFSVYQGGRLRIR